MEMLVEIVKDDVVVGCCIMMFIVVVNCRILVLVADWGSGLVVVAGFEWWWPDLFAGKCIILYRI